MRKTSWSEADVLRVVAIGGATAAVIVALTASKFFYYPVARTVTASTSGTIRAAEDKALASESVSFVTSPTMDFKSEHFVGTGDGSNGYFGERTKSERTRD